jgi:hypothetical protein
VTTSDTLKRIFCEDSRPCINGIPQNYTQAERIKNMSTEELIKKQALAVELYN